MAPRPPFLQEAVLPTEGALLLCKVLLIRWPFLFLLFLYNFPAVWGFAVVLARCCTKPGLNVMGALGTPVSFPAVPG